MSKNKRQKIRTAPTKISGQIARSPADSPIPATHCHTTVREPRLTDSLSLYTQYFSDPHCAVYLTRATHETQERTTELIRRMVLPEATPGSLFCFVIECTDCQCAIGWVTCIPEGRSVALHYGLSRSHWGQGIGTKTVLAVSDHLLASGRFTCVHTTCATTHHASRAVLEKAGFRGDAFVPNSLILPALGKDAQDGVRYVKDRGGEIQSR